MSERTLLNKVRKLKELEQQKKEIEKQIEQAQQEIKNEMSNKGTEEMTAGDYIIRWTSLVRNSFDSKSFKEKHPRLYNQFMKSSESKRFSIV